MLQRTSMPGQHHGPVSHHMLFIKLTLQTASRSRDSEGERLSYADCPQTHATPFESLVVLLLGTPAFQQAGIQNAFMVPVVIDVVKVEPKLPGP